MKILLCLLQLASIPMGLMPPLLPNNISDEQKLQISNRTKEQIALYGCWQLNINSTSVSPMTKASSIICFSSGPKTFSYSMGDNGFGESSFADSTIISNNIIQTDDYKCSYVIHGRGLIIKDCSLKGEWVQKCKDLDDTGGYCK